jgi:mevalonate kinase
MPAFSASAPGKIILFGEHAVVYGRPAIAAPVLQVKAKAAITADPKGKNTRILAPEVQLDCSFDELEPNHPLRAAIQQVLTDLEAARLPACTLKVTSTIPVAGGLGSGAAVSVAVMRAVAAFLGHPLPDERICALAYEVEKLHHGTPSGIDNTVITYGEPVYFVKGQPLERLNVGRAFTIVIADTGIPCPTSLAVGDLRKAWKHDPTHYEALFDSTGALAQSARHALENGAVELLGPLMDANHGLLRKMGVSCAELDALVLAARRAGAWGAKLSGGGRGGNMIALVNPAQAKTMADALLAAGAVRTIITEVK